MGQELTIGTVGLPVNGEVCFSDHKGKHKKRQQKAQLKLLHKLAPQLKPILEPGEVILYTTTACSPMSFLEQWTTGLAIYYVKRCALVVTDRRLLHLPTRSDYKPKQSVSQVRHGDVSKHRVASFLGRSLKLEYGNGKKENFHQVKGGAGSKLKKLLPDLLAQTEGTPRRGRHHLCPRCAEPLPEEEYRCTRCYLEFKDRATAVKYSLVLPGGGYFYTGHPLLGLMDVMAEGVLLLLFIFSLVAAVQGEAGAWVAAVLLGAFLAVEKLITVFHATHYIKEYIPLDKDYSPLTAQR